MRLARPGGWGGPALNVAGSAGVAPALERGLAGGTAPSGAVYRGPSSTDDPARLLVLLLLVIVRLPVGPRRLRRRRGARPARGPATLEVENQNFLDMTVYVVEGGARQRLGEPAATPRPPLTIPEQLIRGGASPLRFLADPIGGEGLPVTEEIVVEPGDAVTLVIPPG